MYFVVEGVVLSLDPGEYCELAGSRQRSVEYHRGDEFGYAQHRLAAGTHAFGLNETGWTLRPIEPGAGQSLLGKCRRKTAP